MRDQAQLGGWNFCSSLLFGFVSFAAFFRFGIVQLLPPLLCESFRLALFTETTAPGGPRAVAAEQMSQAVGELGEGRIQKQIHSRQELGFVAFQDAELPEWFEGVFGAADLFALWS